MNELSPLDLSDTNMNIISLIHSQSVQRKQGFNLSLRK